ncbi:MAG: VWA domain-containing protein [Pseudomonadota bacterium]
MIGDFHFVRPWWWLAWPVLLIIVWGWWRKRPRAGAWAAVCDPHLLPALLMHGRASRWRGWALGSVFFTGSMMIAALAGPVWLRAPQAVFRADTAQIIVLSLSASMDATDVPPSRVARARLKVLDLLRKVDDAQVALIVYAGSAHIVAPLTDDAKTIANLVPVLSTDLLPEPGARLELALAEANAMLQRQAIPHGHVILIGDDAGDAAADIQAQALRAAGHRLSVLSVGTAQGAPIPRAGGGFAKNVQGSILLPRLDEGRLMDLANAGGGQYVRLRADDADINALASLSAAPSAGHSARPGDERSTDAWVEQGPWLLLVVLPLALFGFRRGVLIVCVAVLWGLPQPSYAWQWQDLWLRRDQQAQRLLEDDQALRAAEVFADTRWRSVAQYRAGNFNEAAQGFLQQQDADAHYNRGNALARAGRYDDAIAAYEQALRAQAGHEDAQYNLDLLKKARKQGQKQPQDGQKNPSQGQDGQAQQQQNSSSTPQPGEQGKQPEQAQDQARAAQKNAPQDQTGEQNAAQPQRGKGEDGEKLDAEDNPQSPTQKGAAAQSDAQREHERYVVQQLRRVPDDPGGLLRQKFLREQQRRQGQTKRGERP